ncbi:MAG: hypothetical protein A2271_01035 [Candidatus Moranbacteria bacterium RIFOXYA12_FULL_35_19]|nr:MAG: hypothetical protein UR78_C0005G0031 [Candidatus Moranbacteria bacterium GW2011_GWF2_35_39]OGI32601.1 MAG: hypothetical protein A2489_02740 [Candidatus Moranbacteria bacterium RIFOXYC12_FULL_36_13]OGI32886.1 MAG: hypothetical protein A2343_02315 [Candidatus Moranbacteria bacterium RIFOXYB12_FULL_35_8]OGI36484.1 MAG: hypothetical protein A2271_01035 [Candidatus Moranbacteria bacterium RIFOXYA12_FULL_35_19]
MWEKKSLNKKNKGSVLVVTLLILTVILISVLSTTLVAVKERKASMGSAISNKAYQASEEGIETVMQAITRGNHDYINNSNGVNNLYDYLPNGLDCNTSTGLLEGTDYNVQLLDRNSTQINCNDTSRLVSEIVKIKSVGTSSNSKRAVEALVLNKSTKLLMHFNENPPTDSSYFYDGYTIDNTGVTFSNDSPAALDDTDYATFSSAGNYIKIGDNDDNDGIDFNFLDQDFTIEARVNIKNTSLNRYATIVSQYEGPNINQFNFFYGNNTGQLTTYQKLCFRYYITSGTPYLACSTNPVNLLTGWHHIAVERKGTNLYFFVDESQTGMIYINSREIRNVLPQKDVYIGAALDGASSSINTNYQFVGDMDELRITKGIARFPTSTNFAPWEIEYQPND